MNSQDVPNARNRASSWSFASLRSVFSAQGGANNLSGEISHLCPREPVHDLGSPGEEDGGDGGHLVLHRDVGLVLGGHAKELNAGLQTQGASSIATNVLSALTKCHIAEMHIIFDNDLMSNNDASFVLLKLSIILFVNIYL